MSGLRGRQDDSMGKWAKELPNVLWAYQPTLRKLTRETLFLIIYGAKVVIPVEVGLPTSQIEQFEVDENSHLLSKHLDLIKENHVIASVKLGNY